MGTIHPKLKGAEGSLSFFRAPAPRFPGTNWRSGHKPAIMQTMLRTRLGDIKWEKQMWKTHENHWKNRCFPYKKDLHRVGSSHLFQIPGPNDGPRCKMLRPPGVRNLRMARLDVWWISTAGRLIRTSPSQGSQHQHWDRNDTCIWICIFIYKYVIIYIIFNWISVYKISGPWDLQHLSGLFRWLRTPMIIVSIAWRRVLDLSPHFLDGDLIYLNILYISLAFHGVHPSPAWVVGSSCCPLANQQFATENGPVIGWSTENGDSPVRKL